MAIGSFRHLVQLEKPGPPVPDGEGGFTEGFAPLDPPTWYCSIAQASTRDLESESIAESTVLSQATHIVKGRYHKGITTESRVLYRGRILNVLHVVNVDERDIETRLVCSEVIA